MLSKIEISTRKMVTRSAVLPGMTSGGAMKLIQDTTTIDARGR